MTADKLFFILNRITLYLALATIVMAAAAHVPDGWARLSFCICGALVIKPLSLILARAAVSHE